MNTMVERLRRSWGLFKCSVLVLRETSTANPFKIMAKSAATIKQTWGGMLAVYAGLRGAGVLFVWASLVYWGMAVWLGFVLSNFWLLLPAGGLWLLCLFAYLYLAGVASKVYLCALYVYASEGVVPAHYDEEMMNMAWKIKGAGSFPER